MLFFQVLRSKCVQILSDAGPPWSPTEMSGAELSRTCINGRLQRDAIPVDIMMSAIITLSGKLPLSMSSRETLKCKIDSLGQGWQCCYLNDFWTFFTQKHLCRIIPERMNGTRLLAGYFNLYCSKNTLLSQSNCINTVFQNIHRQTPQTDIYIQFEYTIMIKCL